MANASVWGGLEQRVSPSPRVFACEHDTFVRDFYMHDHVYYPRSTVLEAIITVMG